MPRHGRRRPMSASTRTAVLVLLVACSIVVPVAPVAAADPPPPLSVAMAQTATSYTASTNKARVDVTVTPSGVVPPWQYSVAVRGTVVSSGTSSATSVTVTVTNDCSITTQSVTAQVTDAADRTVGTAATLDRTLCPPPPDYPHARDRILAGPTLTEASFMDRLRAVGSPALSEGRAIYRTLVAGGVNPAFSLGTFQAESHSGTRGYATVTKNWGNILYYEWTTEFGAVPYKPGNGYTYARFPSWHDSIRAYVDLLQRYDRNGYTTVSSASARWLGTIEGSDRHLRYLTNITNVMRILPDDAVPSMTGLVAPSPSRASVTARWSARDNLGVTGYQFKTRRGTGAWTTAQRTTARTTTLTLASGTWTIAVRATDAAGNWSSWRYTRVSVDARLPTMTSLRTSAKLVRSPNGAFIGSWSAIDNRAVTHYQWRLRSQPDGVASTATFTTARSVSLRPHAGTWDFEVRARDSVGNWSPWSVTRLIVPRDDRAFSFSAGTVRRTAPAAFRSTLTTTASRDATLRYTVADATGFYLVGRVGPSYGKLRLTIDGVSTVIDTAFYRGQRATRVYDAVLLYSQPLSPGVHSVTITNLATTQRPTIAIDALDFSR